jgi:uncharacterized protein
MATNGNIASFYGARPDIRVDDEVNRGLGDGLLRLLVEETTEGLYRCEMTFGNWGTAGGEAGLLYDDGAVLDFGKRIAVRAGADDAAGELFAGRIFALEAQYPEDRQPTMTVLAEDRLQDLRMTRRTRTFEERTDADIARAIAAAHGLQADVDLDGPRHAVVVQLNQSDLAFLRERARLVGAELWLFGDRLKFAARSRRQSPGAALTYGRELIELRVLADLARQRTSVHVNGWDVSAKEAIAHQADEATVLAELNGHSGGATVLQRSFGARAERLVHLVPTSDAEARQLAEASFRQGARRFLVADGIASGDARIRVGARLTLRGLGRTFSGDYYVTEVRHSFALQDGFRTRFRCERPGIDR